MTSNLILTFSGASLKLFFPFGSESLHVLVSHSSSVLFIIMTLLISTVNQTAISVGRCIIIERAAECHRHEITLFRYLGLQTAQHLFSFKEWQKGAIV